MTFLVALQVPIAAYFSLFHQSGTIAVVDWLAGRSDTSSVFFFMPCHSTPFSSHFHRDIPMRFLDCSPPGWAERVAELNAVLPSHPWSSILDAEDLKQSPADVLKAAIAADGDSTARPSHIIMFDAAANEIDVAATLDEQGYKQTASFFHSHFAVDHNGLQSRVLVFADPSAHTRR